jgi:DNA-binding transcriptional LysR family regulator
MTLDPDLLRSFLAVAQSLSFTQAAQRLGLRQPTVSQHVRKLEEVVARPLFIRDTRSVTLTADGEAMAGFARTILAAHEQAAGYFSGSGLRGRLRFGVSDDLALTALPRILRDFRQLHRRLESGHLDVAFVKHDVGDGGGRLVRRDRLVWAAVQGLRLSADRPMPLVVYQAPSLSRSRAVEALDRAGLPYRITCTVRGVNGILAAARTGLGVAIFARSLVPDDLVELPASADLPELGEIDLVLLTNPRAATEPAEALTTAILSSNPVKRG